MHPASMQLQNSTLCSIGMPTCRMPGRQCFCMLNYLAFMTGSRLLQGRRVDISVSWNAPGIIIAAVPGWWDLVLGSLRGKMAAYGSMSQMRALRELGHCQSHVQPGLSFAMFASWPGLLCADQSSWGIFNLHRCREGYPCKILQTRVYSSSS